MTGIAERQQELDELVGLLTILPPKASALMLGDHSAYKSQSEAELALCSFAAAKTGNDRKEIDRIFRMSGLMRSKWDTPRGDSTYGGMTIAKATEGMRPAKKPRCEASLIESVDLIKMDFPEPRWAVPGILSEGLNLLAGKPKKGKSIMALNIAIAIAQGGLALEKIPVQKGGVIYLALEDTNRRLRDRLALMVSDGNIPGGIFFATQWPKMGDGGLEALGEKAQETKDLRLVIIDTLQKFRPPLKSSSNAYGTDYDAVAEIKSLADRLSVACLVIHHQRKSASDDIFDTISGTLGLGGAADTLLVLEQGVSKALSLCMTGRDIEDRQLAVKMHKDRLSWELLGDRANVMNTDAQQRVFDAVKRAGKGESPAQIAKAIGANAGYVRKTLKRLEERGLLEASGGLYECVEPPSQVQLPFEGVE